MEPIRWGIIGPGNIAKRFVAGLNVLPDAELLAVGSRDAARGKAFADEHGAERSYGSYEELVADPDVDAVYVATPHSRHLDCGVLALEAGKAVLVEKPFTINEAQARELVAVARRENRFLMEAMWTRFLPVTVKVREWIASGAIGEPRMLEAAFGFRADFKAEGRLFDPEHGGGGLLDVGVYPVSYAHMIFGAEPDEVASFAEVGKTGVDEQAVISLKWGAGEKLAALACGIRTRTTGEAWISGTDNDIRVDANFWNGSKAALLVRDDVKEAVDLPYEGSGFEFEIAEVGRCLREGQTESETMSLDESIAVMRTMDRLRALWGVKYPME